MSPESSTNSRTEPTARRRWRGIDATSLVFLEWCLRREAPRWRPALFRLSVLIPAVVAWWFAATIWPDLAKFGSTSVGAVAMTQLMFIAAFSIVVGGVQFASRAICWEISPEMRDLVRLTGLGATTLLWTKTAARWWTMGWSVLLILPLAAYAVTMGGVSNGQLLAGAAGLSMLTALMCGIGMLASVTSADAKNPEKTATNTTFAALVLYNLAFVLLSIVVSNSDWNSPGTAWNSASVASRILNCAPTVTLANVLRSPTLFEPTDPGFWLHFLFAFGCAWLAMMTVESRFRRSHSFGDADAGSSIGLASIQPYNLGASPLTSVAIAMEQQSEVPIVTRSSSSVDVKPATSRRRPRGSNRLGEILTNLYELAPTSGGRPRCSDRPFFWKDVHVLSEERKWLNGWTLFYFVAALGILGLSVFVTHDARGYGFATMAVVSIVAVAGIISTRFDALLATEFRERTWGSLMLLPVDPCDLLWTKLEAAISEQRFAALPLIAAQLSLAIFGPHASLVVAGITAVISVLICGLLCQMSCLNHLLGKAWWISPCQMIGFAAVIVVAFMIWSNFGLWLGFLLTVAMLISVLCLLHVSFVRPIARSWVET